MIKKGFCVFFILDGSDILVEKLKNMNLDFDIRFTTIADIRHVVSDIQVTTETKNTNLVIINKEKVNEDTIKNINLTFTETNKLRKPQYLYISGVTITNDELDQISSGQNYFYFVPEKINENIDVITINLVNLISFIYHKIINIDRLNDYIINSFQTIVDSAIINKQKAEIEILNEKLHAMSMTDFLTKVLNRRAFFDKMEEEKSRTLRDYWRIANAKNGDTNMDDIEKIKKTIAENYKKAPQDNPIGVIMDHYGRFSCVLMDIDHFKKINDTYGHLIGDEVLRQLGDVLASKDIFRENDIVARYGGEEFVVLLPETSAQHARIPAERFREKMKSIVFYNEQKEPFHISVSLGISEFRITDEDNESLINRADQALYYAKENGRDRVVIFEEVFKDK